MLTQAVIVVRILRAVAPQFPQLRRLIHLVYETVRHHKFINSIDSTLHTGDFKKLCTLCSISDYKEIFSVNVTGSSLRARVGVNDQFMLLKQPKLPDLESHMHIEHAELILELENKLADDAEFPCASCERLLQRKQVTAFNFAANKFSSDIWKALKAHIKEEFKCCCTNTLCLSVLSANSQ